MTHSLPSPCGVRDVLLSKTVLAWGGAASAVDAPHFTDEVGFGSNLLLFSTYVWVETKLFKYVSKTSFSWDTDVASALLLLFFKRPRKPRWGLLNLNLSFSAVIRICAELSSICNCSLSFFMHLADVTQVLNSLNLLAFLRVLSSPCKDLVGEYRLFYILSILFRHCTTIPALICHAIIISSFYWQNNVFWIEYIYLKMSNHVLYLILTFTTSDIEYKKGSIVE